MHTQTDANTADTAPTVHPRRPAATRPGTHHHNRYHGLHPLVAQLSRAHAHWLVTRGGIPRTEFQDLQQELAIAIHIATTRTQPPAQVPPALLRTIARNTAISLRRQYFRERRHSSPPPLSRDASQPHYSQPPRLHRRRRSQPSGRTNLETLQLRLDVHAVIQRLPITTRRVALGLLESSRADVADQLALSQRTIERHIAVMREFFQYHSLDQYLGTRRHAPRTPKPATKPSCRTLTTPTPTPIPTHFLPKRPLHQNLHMS